jgi:hypothetical protein
MKTFIQGEKVTHEYMHMRLLQETTPQCPHCEITIAGHR